MKKHIAFIVALLIISALIFQSCQIHCSAFPEWLCKYAPYEEGNTITFANENDSTIKLKVENKDKTEKYSFGKNCKCVCDCHNYTSLKMFTTAEQQEKLQILLICDLDVGRRSPEKYEIIPINFHVSISDGYRGDDVYTTLNVVNPYEYGSEQKLNDTIVLQNETTKYFSCATIVKGKGLTEFYDKENNCTWRLAE